MASKRELEGVLETEPTEPARKRPKAAAGSKREHQNANIDPTWGQKYVFSSLGDATTVPTDPDIEFEDDGDAMAYLSSVRYAPLALSSFALLSLPSRMLNGRVALCNSRLIW